jgi:uncharacterized OB-fold protein
MSSTWDRPLPEMSPETLPFWEATKEGKFLIQQCGDCEKFQYHYRGFCCHCWSSNINDYPIEGTGTVWTFTVVEINRSPGFRERLPYVVALIELPQGIKVLSNVINCDVDEVEIGMPVKLTFEDATDDFKIPMFEPAR